MKYKHVIFDFDNTLWDFSQNSKESLKELYNSHERLQKAFDSFERFFETYEKNNNALWQRYRDGEIDKEFLAVNRFAFTLREGGIFEVEYAQKLNSEYLALTTTKTLLIPNALEILKYLKDKKYEIHILTDGFFEVQFLKLKQSKLAPYISNLITSEEFGKLKPDPDLFNFALEKINASKEQTIMVGDDYENDIIGAYEAGIDQIFFNRKNIPLDSLEIKPTYTIHNLLEIKQIL